MARIDRWRERADRLGAGQTFAGYELEEFVNDGSIDVVYKARDVRLQRTVAVRIVAPELTDDPVTRARLNREATAIARVDHPNVLPIHEVGEHDGRLFIASAWVDGRRLSTLVHDEGPLEPRRAVGLINQAARALQATHDHGILHRNVRPSSLLVNPSDHLYLTDFEYARPLTGQTLVVLRDQLLEEVDYVAPEYITGETADFRADIYGLGCVLYEALTGEVPFPAATVAAKVYAHRFSEPPSARDRRPELPEALDAVIARAMAKAPAERQQSAGEFAIEAAGAVHETAPLWATRRRFVDTSAHDEHGEGPLAEGRGAQDGQVEVSELGQVQLWEPAFFSSRGRRLRLWVLGALVLLFVAVPAVLLLTVR
jgi:serine/threonine protein kinase